MSSRITTFCLLVSLAGADALAAQSLAGLAQQEEDRRKALKTPARVITDKDLRPTPATEPKAVPAASSSSPAEVAKVADDNSIRVAAAQYRGGALPQIPVQAVAGGEVLLELTVSSEGRVVAAKALRHTPPFTDALAEAVRTWEFRPAEDGDVPKPGELVDPKTRKAVESRVLVAGMFRPPALFSTTLGEPSKDVAASADEIPFPLTPARMPLYPPMAIADGVVLVELRVGLDGRLLDTTVIRSAPAFDQSALDALQRMTFRPARVHGLAAPTFVYAVLGFRRPVTPAVTAPSGNQQTNPNRP